MPTRRWLFWIWQFAMGVLCCVRPLACRVGFTFPKNYVVTVFRLLTLSVDCHVERFQNFALWQKSFRHPFWNSNIPFLSVAKLKWNVQTFWTALWTANPSNGLANYQSSYARAKEHSNSRINLVPLVAYQQREMRFYYIQNDANKTIIFPHRIEISFGKLSSALASARYAISCWRRWRCDDCRHNWSAFVNIFVRINLIGCDLQAIAQTSNGMGSLRQ